MALLNFYFWKGYRALGYVSIQPLDFPNILFSKSWGSSYLKLLILNIKHCFTCGKFKVSRTLNCRDVVTNCRFELMERQGKQWRDKEPHISHALRNITNWITIHTTLRHDTKNMQSFRISGRVAKWDQFNKLRWKFSKIVPTKHNRICHILTMGQDLERSSNTWINCLIHVCTVNYSNNWEHAELRARLGSRLINKKQKFKNLILFHPPWHSTWKPIITSLLQMRNAKYLKRSIYLYLLLNLYGPFLQLGFTSLENTKSLQGESNFFKWQYIYDDEVFSREENFIKRRPAFLGDSTSNRNNLRSLVLLEVEDNPSNLQGWFFLEVENHNSSWHQ